MRFGKGKENDLKSRVRGRKGKGVKGKKDYI